MFAPTSRPVGIIVGWLADQVFADPRRGHPVALFGRAATAVERATYRDGRRAGSVHTLSLLAAVAALTVCVQRAVGRTGALTAATWLALGGTSLTRTGAQMANLLTANDIAAARHLLPSLCGRDPDVLDGDDLIRAALESVAENTSDAHVAPLVWTVIGGAPGAVVYRAVNTLDAMIGYRSPRYARFGWAAARVDDVANIVPARITAMLVVVCAPAAGGSPARAARAWRRDAARHPSPNAGVAESAFAGALGVGLGGPTHYPHGVEIRPMLGDGPPPDVEDLRRAVRLSRAVQGAAVVLAIASVTAGGRIVRRVSARC